MKIKIFTAIMLSFMLCATALAAPARKRGAQRKKANAILRGSHASLVKQNIIADKDGLSRIEDDLELERFIAQGLLVPLPKTKAVKIDGRLDGDLRYCRPWTRNFLINVGTDYRRHFGKSIRVNSAVRTAIHQKHLRRKNGNAAPVSGETASSHLTGATIDIAKKKMPAMGITWMRTELKRLERLGFIEATEEFHQAVFHVMVFKKYSERRVK